MIAEQIRWHALPQGWTGLPYDEFLVQRRKLMAEVTRTAFQRLADHSYTPTYPPAKPPEVTRPVPSRTSYAVRVADLVDAGLLAADAILINPTDDVEATVRPDGRIEFDGTVYDAPSGASDAAHGSSTNGWTYWLADTSVGLRPLATLRDDLMADDDNDS